MTDVPPEVVQAAKDAFKHNCRPNAATGYVISAGIEWLCPCGKRWRKSTVPTGWERVA